MKKFWVRTALVIGVLLVLLLVVAGVMVYRFIVNGVVLYSDDFSNSQSGMPIYDDNAGTKLQYSGGQYDISAPEGNSFTWACANRNYSNAALVVDSQFVSGNATKVGPAILWRVVDLENAYFLEMTTGDGQLSIGKSVKGQPQVLKDWASTDAINKGQQKNKIAVSFNGAISNIYINGKYVTRIQDSSFTSGDVCVAVFPNKISPVEVSFDNLVVHTLNGWTPSNP